MASCYKADYHAVESDQQSMEAAAEFLLDTPCDPADKDPENFEPLVD